MPSSLHDTVQAPNYPARMPDDLWLCIFSHLPLEDRIRISRVCTRWHDVCRDPSLWRVLDFSLCSGGKLTTDETVRGVLNHATETRIVDLSGANCKPITDRALGHVGRSCPYLKQLKVSSRKVSDGGVRYVVRRCQSLRLLDFESCENISDRGLRAIVKYCPNLESLSVAHCSKISDEAIGLIARKCSALRTLNVAGCRNLTDESLVSIGQHCANLERINLKQTAHITIYGIESLVRMTPTLTHVQLGIVRDNEQTMRAVQLVVNHCQNLKFISFQHHYNPRVQGGTHKIAKQNLSSYVSGVGACVIGSWGPV